MAAEVAEQSVNSYDWGGKLASRGPCDGMAGRQELNCLEREGEGPVPAAEVARPLQDSITNALVVKPYMLLQYGRILDPGKPADRKAYAVHLKWVTGGYTAHASGSGGDDPCRLVAKPARKYCESERAGDSAAGDLPALTPGGELLDASNAVVSEEDREFAAFLADLNKAGTVGKASAAYAEKPTWWRIGGALLLLVAALFIAGMMLSSALVLLATQAACAGAAAAAGVAFVAAMLPGPARQSVWKWLSLWGIACLTVVGVCAFIPFFAIAVDATITDGPDLMVERMLLIVAMAVVGAALHRRLLAGISGFGQRMAMRMRYAKIGGTHLPGDTSELGAALAMNAPSALGSSPGGMRTLTGGGGRFGILGTRQRLMGALASMADGTGMPVDTGRLLSDASAEAGRGLAPLTAGAAVAGLGARLGARGAHWLLIGRRPDREQLARWQRPTADGDDTPTAPGGPGGHGGPAGPGGGGPSGGGLGSPLRPRGPGDRHRDEDGQIVDRTTGAVLHDQNTDRTLLATRAHNRLVRFRGYRILNRTTRTAYATTASLPTTTRRARAGATRYAHDARQQVRVWGNAVREDGRAWGDAAGRAARAVRDGGDHGGPAPFTSRRISDPAMAPRASGPNRNSPLPAPPPHPNTVGRTPRPPAQPRPAPPPPPARPTAQPGRSGASSAPPPRLRGSTPRPPAPPAPDPTSTPLPPRRPNPRPTSPPPQGSARPAGSALPGRRTPRSDARRQAEERFRELLRRTDPGKQPPPTPPRPPRPPRPPGPSDGRRRPEPPDTEGEDG
ncbi:hypothetical protein [Streptomyces sp. NPDC058739]|uniref:hypothetical protein n=1 Tax=Streptomyces sp. NPDC058739 TaxID=3346618 RepID=UPI00369ADF59